MKVVILAGGYGTRISEESYFRPKPMIEIGGQPILWHIMKYYFSYGYDEFIICAGYKQECIKDYFANYYMHCNDVTFDFRKEEKISIHKNVSESWEVTVVNTGLDTMTGGRIKRIKNLIGDEDFLLTYGDGVSDVPIDKVVELHRQQKKIITITAVQIGGRFGTLEIQPDLEVSSFAEKKKEDGGWINGGFMVASPQIFDRIEGDSTIFEREPLESLVKDRALIAYKHNGFWQCMDTMRDKENLERMWENGQAPWKRW